VIAAVALTLGLSPPGAAGAASAVLLGVTLIDTSTEGDYNPPRADEAARIAMLDAELSQALADRGWQMIDRAALTADLAAIVNPADCNGCDARLARRLGADFAVTAEVQKVSNLILTINVLIRDAESGKLVAAGTAEIRSNTDRAWHRGLAYVLRNRIVPQLDARGIE